MCKMEITDLIKGRKVQMCRIFTFFFTRTALWLLTPLPPHLLCYFPEMEMESVFCSDSKRHRIIQGFALETGAGTTGAIPVSGDDDCIRIMCVL